MARHLIAGAGPIGSAVARRLLKDGHEVVVVTRSGSGPDGTTKVATDVADAARLAELAEGAAAIYNCLNPPYPRWETDWPPLADSLLNAARSSGAVLATTGNLYNYGRVSGPMTEQTPEHPNGHKGEVRKRMWADAKAAHDRGEIRAFEVRGSDYVGGPAQGFVSGILLPAWTKGKAAIVPGPLGVPHTWTDVEDVAALLVRGAEDERAWGRVWHVPSDDAVTIRQLADLVAAAGAPRLQRRGLHGLPYAAVWLAGLRDPFVKELRETQYQFRAPFLLDSSETQETFGLTPTPLAESVGREVQEFLDKGSSSTLPTR